MSLYYFAFLWQAAYNVNDTVILRAQGAPPDSPLAPMTSFQVMTVDGEAIEGPLVVGQSYGVGDPNSYLLTLVYLGATVNGDPLFQNLLSSVGSPLLLLTNNASYNVGDTLPLGDVVCFLAGTLIATPDGERPVEELQPGDLVLTADGRAVSVRFVGRQTVDARFAEELRGTPVRIRAGALDEAVPRRDLYLSPNHAVAVDGILAFASALRNGTSIADAPPPAPRFTWFSVETERHELILAEGCPVETFLDVVPRRLWDNYREYLALYGEEPVIEELPLPKAQSARQLPRRVRERITTRAQALAGIEAAAA